jgi:hypothetical protein
LRIESEMIMAEGEKLNDALVEELVGAVSEQFITQHKRTIFICGICCSALFIFLQHFIWLFAFPECRGIPASTPPAREMSKNKDVSHFFILRLFYSPFYLSRK